MCRRRLLDVQPLPLGSVTETPCGRPPRSRTWDTDRRSSADQRRKTTGRQPHAHSGAQTTARLGPKRQIPPTPPRTPTPDPSLTRRHRRRQNLRASDEHEIESDGLLLAQPRPTPVPGLNRWTPTANHRGPHNPASLTAHRRLYSTLRSKRNSRTPINQNSITWTRNQARRPAARTARAHPLRAHPRSLLFGRARRPPPPDAGQLVRHPCRVRAYAERRGP